VNGAVKAETGEVRARAIRRTERGAEAFAAAERHSRRVRVLKVVLPALAVLVASLFLGYSLFSSISGGAFNFDSASIEGGNLVMHNPTLNGFTGDNRPYSMTAALARQIVGSDTGPIELEAIRATVPINAEDRATVSAGSGIFDRENDSLKLSGAVTVQTSTGIRARLQSANVDISSGNLLTDEPVLIEMDGMRVSANTFRAMDRGRKLVFDDHVRVEIDPARVRRTQQREGGESE